MQPASFRIRNLVCFFILFVNLAATSAEAQDFEGLPDYGDFTADDLSLKKCAFDKEANAVVLMDLARSSYNDQHNLVTQHRTRIKILNEKGFDEANISIPYYKKDDYEYVTAVKGIIKNYDDAGKLISETVLERKAIFDRKVNDYWNEIRFTMPNVKAGSIFEYSFEKTSKSYSALDEWVFQTNIPTVISKYDLVVLPNAEFAYQVYKLPTIPINVKKGNMDGQVLFEMTNIAGLRDEAFMDSRKDNLQRVAFQLSGYNRGMGLNKYVTKWDDVAQELLTTAELGGQLNKSLDGTADFIKATKALPDPMQRLKAVYSYVQKRMGWNGFNSKYTVDGIKKAWDKASGTNGEMNLILVNLLRDVNVEAMPLLVSDRQHAKVNTTYPFLDQFNRLATYVMLPGKNLVVDAADKTTPLGMLPLTLLNTHAYIVDRKKQKLIFLEDKKLYYTNMINITGELGNDGVLQGTAIINSSDYARMDRKRYYERNDAKKFMERYFHSSYSNLQADSLQVEKLDNDSVSLSQHVVFKQTLNSSGDYSFLNMNLFTGYDKNPLTSDIRFSDVNFGSPQRCIVSQTIFLPDGYEPDVLPKNISLITPDTAFSMSRRTQYDNGRILLQLKIEMNKSFFPQDEYEMLQAFFKKMYSLLEEQVVLKKKK